MDNSVNAEVFRILHEKVEPRHDDEFFRAIIAYLKNIVEIPTVKDVRDFYDKIWKGAVRHENEDRRKLGEDY